MNNISTNKLPNLQTIEKIEVHSSQEFFNQYALPGKPVVLKNFASDWNALKKWTPEYFISKYGNNDVQVYDGNFSRPGKSYMSKAKMMKFDDYLNSILYKGKDLRMFLYNIISKAPELREDVKLPPLMKGFSKKFLFMFFGPKDAVTQIHYDIDMSHVFHTAIVGKKRFILFDQTESKNLYRHPFTIRSYVDVDNPDFEKFPALKKVQGYEVILEPGETLFIPSGFWHHVVYEEAGYAISLRCPHHHLHKRIEGIFNILFMQMVDRFVNKLAPLKWFKWKEKKAFQLAKDL
ncbi:MAG: transcription factor [Halobacteriovoraceae bacterium]|nr:transcription factor [Halobacteriovoraceae bacterium]MBC99516.1 transcription factor [Halobacteriovoraceae bacterium]|tara:strand:- start:193849 stop:194721 length:873 start_codon:yes stop_codon:yes gene_type:complete